MADYTLAVGTHDPSVMAAADDAEAVRIAARSIAVQYAEELRTNPQEVVTLIGPGGLVTRPSERVDEFMHRAGSIELDSNVLQPGDANAPDCNGD